MLFLFLLATTLVACKSTSVVLPTTTTDSTTTKTVTVKIHDTVFRTEKDSSYYKAYLECVNGKVQFNKDRIPVQHSGKYLQAPKVSLKGQVIYVDCEARAQELFANWKDTYIATHQAVIKHEPYPVPLQLTWWQTTEIWLGRIFLGLIICIILVGAYKASKPI